VGFRVQRVRDFARHLFNKVDGSDLRLWNAVGQSLVGRFKDTYENWSPAQQKF
jgi:hypothetical protein